MKIIITATLFIHADKRSVLLEELAPHILKTRKQTGCVRYEWAADGVDETQINVLEEWEDASAVDGHFAGDNFAKIVGIIGTHDIISMSARKYGISKEAPVFNAQGKPSSSF